MEYGQYGMARVGKSGVAGEDEREEGCVSVTGEMLLLAASRVSEKTLHPRRIVGSLPPQMSVRGSTSALHVSRTFPIFSVLEPGPAALAAKKSR